MSGGVSGANLPYAAKYLKDRHTACSKCKKMPAQEELLLGIREFCDNLGQHTDRWFHATCFFPAMRQKGADITEAAIRGMSWLKWEDQESIREHIEEYNLPPGAAGTSTARPRQCFTSCRAEHAKSARGKCGSCKQNIPEGEAKYFSRGAHHHLGCFLSKDVMFTGPIESIQGYPSLKQEAKDALKQAYDDYKNGPKAKSPVKVEVKTDAGDHATASMSTSTCGDGNSMSEETMMEEDGGVEGEDGGGDGAATTTANDVPSNSLLAMARKMAQARKDVVILGPDGAQTEGGSAAAAAAADPAPVSPSAPASAAPSAASVVASPAKHTAATASSCTVVDDDDGEIQLLDVVKTDKPPVVTIGQVEMKQIESPQKSEERPKPSNSLNDLFARFQKKDKERTSLGSVMETLSKKPRIEEEMGKDQLNELLKKQAQALWQLREKFERTRDQDIHELMKTNDMGIPNDHQKLVMAVADATLFGSPGQCPKCPDGRLMFNADVNTYICTGDITEWTKCTYTNKNPTRSPFGIPRSLGSIFSSVQHSGVMNSMPKRYYPAGGEEALNRMGAQAMAVSAELAEGELSKNVQQKPAAAHLNPLLNSMASYLPASLAQYVQRPAAPATAATGGKQFIKRGTVVDGECTVASESHVYRDDEGVLFSCSLTQADMATNRNSYFKMQLLQHDMESDRFFVFKSWGRVGTDLGGSETMDFRSLAHAKADFLNTFTEKTGNDWSDKKYFRKRPGKMAMVDMDYSEIEQSKTDEIAPGSITKLEKSVQQLILRIFDKDMFKSALRSFDLDMEQMPLGKLSKRQLTLAYAVLNELQELMQSSPERSQITDASNRFYSLIPHNFGHKPPEMLDTKEIIEKKSKLIENLMDIAIAVDLMNEGDRREVKMGVMAMDPIDVKYLTLKSEIKALPKTSPEFKMIEKYAKNTHGSTHYTKIKITDVFCLEREGEDMRFKHDLGNRMLLWHGSRLSNFVGIISQGLRIAPPEAPHAGYMFGKGIYFADMISKSANYCHPDLSGNDAFLLLCDVALGAIQEEPNATGVNPLRNGNNAVKGTGYQFPDPSDFHYHPDGYVVPFGQKTHALQKIYLEYNEYIVYDMAQVRIKYLVRTQMSVK